MVPLSVVVCFALLSGVIATDVQQCPNKSVQGLSEAVTLTPCKRLPCRLKKGTNTHISITFTPEKDITQIKNSVTGEVFGIPLPFIGVDGGSVCDKLFTETGEKASCPVTAGTKYVYKDSFPILSIYPSTDVVVQWALKGSDNDIICFKVPARIQ